MIISKKILFGCISLLLLILCIIFTKQANDDYQSDLVYKEFNIHTHATSIKIPVEAYDNDTYVKIIKMLKQVSTQSDINIIKQEYLETFSKNKDGTFDYNRMRQRVSYYAVNLQNSSLDKMFDRKLKNGYYYSSLKNLPKNNLGIEFEVSNLGNKYHTREGYYFLDTKNPEKINQVKQVLASEFSKNFNNNYTVDDFSAVKFKPGYKLRDNFSYSFTISSLIAVIAIFIVIYVIIYSREITIYKLNGLTSLEIFNKIFLKDYAISIIAVTIIYYPITRLLNWTLYKVMLTSMAKELLFTFMLIFIVSLISIRLSSVSVLKGKEYTKYIFYVSYLVKGALGVSLISSIIPLVQIGYSAENYVKNHVDSKQNYAVFYPVTTGYDYHTIMNPIEETKSLDQKFYRFFDDNGAVIFNDLSLYTSPKIDSYEKYKIIYVNNNYLKVQGIQDLYNEKINISNKEKQPVVLLPSDRAFMRQDIVKYVTKAIGFPNPRIIIIKNPDTLETFKNKKAEGYDFLMVLTEHNSDDGDRFSYTNGGIDDPFKIPYKDSPKKTYKEKYKKRMDKYNFGDNYSQLVSIQDVQKEEMKMIFSMAVSKITEIIITITMIIVFSFYTCHFYFTLRKKSIEVKLLMGKSFIKSITGLWLLLGVQYLVSIGYLMRENELNKHNIIALVLMLALEVMIEWLFMTRIARRKLWKQ